MGNITSGYHENGMSCTTNNEGQKLEHLPWTTGCLVDTIDYTNDYSIIQYIQYTIMDTIDYHLIMIILYFIKSLSY